MSLSEHDLAALRSLAGPYAELAHLDVQRERIERYRKTNDIESVRPPVLIDEVPWGEIRDESLTNRCAKELAWLEGGLRRSLYQWAHFQADMVIPPVFQIRKHIRSSGIGLDVRDRRIDGATGSHIAAHEYTDQLAAEADLEKLALPVITYDQDGTERAREQAEAVFAGLLPVEIVGHVFHFSMWDEIARYRGVANLLLDLAARPGLMHRTAARFRDIGLATFRQLVEKDLLHATPLLLHCTPACTRNLPAPDFAGTVRPQDTWGRCAAQILGSVSPDMHDEFDFSYAAPLVSACGLVYYGCCEPLDRKIALLRKRFRNLRKISITPWADVDRAAQNIGRDFVLAAKPNPAFVSSRTFDPKPVEEEIERCLVACRRHGTVCEFVLKDISTIANDPRNLTQWAATASRVIDRFYG